MPKHCEPCEISNLAKAGRRKPKNLSNPTKVGVVKFAITVQGFPHIAHTT
jgi:hypothetical protein